MCYLKAGARRLEQCQACCFPHTPAEILRQQLGSSRQADRSCLSRLQPLLADSVTVLQGVSGTGTSLYVVDKDQGVGLTALTMSMKVERLAVPSQVGF